MGRQLQFYSLEGDKIAIAQFVLEIGGALLPEKTKRPTLEIVRDLSAISDFQWKYNQWLFWKTSIDLNKRFISQKKLYKAPEWYNEYANPDGTFFTIDRLCAPVIEFSPSVIRPDGVLSSGRIWADMTYFEGDKKVDKGEEFRSWYDQIARWIKRKFKS